MTGRHSARVDAVNNDKAIVNAARELAREQGLGELRGFAIAERAGVSAATVRRRFSTKDDMMLAVFTDVRETLWERRAGWLRSRMPGVALEEFVSFLIETERDRRGFLDFVSNLTADTDEWREDFNRVGEELVSLAQRSGQIRDDIVWPDIPFLVSILARTPRWVMAMESGDSEWRRLLAVFFDGLHASHVRPVLPPAPHDTMSE